MSSSPQNLKYQPAAMSYLPHITYFTWTVLLRLLTTTKPLLAWLIWASSHLLQILSTPWLRPYQLVLVVLKHPCHLARIIAAKSSQMNYFSYHTVLSTAGSCSVSNPPTFLFSHLILHASYLNGKDSEYATWGFGRSGAQHCFLLTRIGAKINWQWWAGTNTIS